MAVKLLHAFSRIVFVAKHPLLEKKSKALTKSMLLSLSLWVQSTSQARNQTSTNVQTNEQD
jgi:hypothetical protein